MLKLNQKESGKKGRVIAITIAIILVLVGSLYVLALFFAPAAAPYLVTKPISVDGLPAPTSSNNRIILPRIGVNIPYAKDASALDSGAEWRTPSSGNPEDGGNFVIAARYFSLQTTPLATIERSPFYNISKLVDGDKIIVDYQGKRYGYEIEKTLTVNPTEIAIEARTNNPTLTLYSIDDGASDRRFVIQAKRLGELAAY